MNDYHIAAYYFPNYHEDSRNNVWHGNGWTEWSLLKAATPRYPGHQQPKVPLWGYEDEADPAVMAKKIKAAADHGLEAFVFDWYWYDDGPFLHRALEEGFLKAPNCRDLQFSIMWANHNWVEIQPAIRAECPVRKYGMVDEETFFKAADHMINHYFCQPNYWRIDGKLYLSFYEPYRLVQGLGGLENTKRVLDIFRQKVREKGLGELHLNAVVFGIQILPGETAIQKPEEMLTYLGLDSTTSYVWAHYAPINDFPVTDYETVRQAAKTANAEFAQRYPVPYFPNVTMGWDPSPRTIQTDRFDHLGYPYCPTLGGNTPDAFKKALQDAKDYLDVAPDAQNTLFINAWNEWTEGSYLEPDTSNGFGYLQAIRDVFNVFKT